MTSQIKGLFFIAENIVPSDCFPGDPQRQRVSAEQLQRHVHTGNPRLPPFPILKVMCACFTKSAGVRKAGK